MDTTTDNNTHMLIVQYPMEFNGHPKDRNNSQSAFR